MLPCFMTILAPTDKEAQERYQHILEGADPVAIANLAGDAGKGSGGTQDAFVAKTIFVAQAALVGSYDWAAKTLGDLQDDGVIDGIMCTFPDYIEDTRTFGEYVLPRLREKAAA
jgi:pyrimidine oxygenase